MVDDDDLYDPWSHWAGLVNLAGEVIEARGSALSSAAMALSAAADRLSELGDHDAAIEAATAARAALVVGEATSATFVQILSTSSELAQSELEDVEAEIATLLRGADTGNDADE